MPVLLTRLCKHARKTGMRLRFYPHHALQLLRSNYLHIPALCIVHICIHCFPCKLQIQTEFCGSIQPKFTRILTVQWARQVAGACPLTRESFNVAGNASEESLYSGWPMPPSLLESVCYPTYESYNLTGISSSAIRASACEEKVGSLSLMKLMCLDNTGEYEYRWPRAKVTETCF
jgi:hypothetical protein